MEKIKKIKAICFDMWGTLCEGGGGNEWVFLQRILEADFIDKKTFQEVGIKSLLCHPHSLRDGINDLSSKLGLTATEQKTDKGLKMWWKLVEKSRPYPETIAVLDNLKRLGFKMVIISNTDAESFYYELKKYGLSKYFEKYFISAETGSLKHEGVMFRLAQDYLQLPNNQILLVDDSYEHGVMSARELGWRALWLDRKNKGRDKLRITDLTEIFNFLL